MTPVGVRPGARDLQCRSACLWASIWALLIVVFPSATLAQPALEPAPRSGNSATSRQLENRCAFIVMEGQRPRQFCVRQVAMLPSDLLRVTTYFSTDSTEGPPALSVSLDSKPLRASQVSSFGTKPMPLRLMLLLQLSEEKPTASLTASARELVEAAFKIPNSTVGIVAYERNRHVVKELAPTAQKEEVLSKLAELETYQVEGVDGQAPSLSDGLSSLLGLVEQRPPRNPAFSLAVALNNGADDILKGERPRVYADLAGRMNRANLALDILFYATKNVARPSLELRELANRTGGFVLESAPTENLQVKAKQYASLLTQQQISDLVVPSRSSSDTDRHRVAITAATDPPMTVALEVPLVLPQPPKPVEQGAPPSPPVRAVKHESASGVWWWLDGLLVLVITGLLLVPRVRNFVLSTIRGDLLPNVALVQAYPSQPHNINTLTFRITPERRPPAPRKAVEWVDAFRPGRSHTHVGWLLRPDNGRVHYIEKMDLIIGTTPICDIFFNASSPAPLRCRLYREPSSGQMVLYPLDGTMVEHKGQRLTGPSYIFDQDEILIGTCRFRYFETKVSL